MGLLETLGLKPLKTPELAGVAAAGDKGDASVTPPPPKPSATGPSGPGPAKEMLDFQVARAEVQKLVNDLNAHAQKAKIVALINQATAKLTQADAHAAKAEFVDAKERVEEARALCIAARKLADDWAAYAKKRATVWAQVLSLTGFVDPPVMATLKNTVAAADALAAASPPNFVNATATLDSIDTQVRPAIKTGVDAVKTRLAKVEAMDAKVKAFAATEIASAKKLVAQADKAFTDGEWSLCIMTKNAAMDVLGPTDRMGERRAKYDTQRAKTAAVIATVKAAPAVTDHAAELDALVAQADALAGHATMKIEDGVRLLEDAAARGAVWIGVAPTIATHNGERKSADAELAALDTHPAAAKVAEARTAVRKLLQDASKFATAGKAGKSPVQDWGAALTLVRRARADLAEAKKLADSLAPALAAQNAAANPADVAGMKTALKALRTDFDAAQKAPFAAEADADFKRCKAAADKADAALAKNDGKAGAKALAEASQALAAARAIQVEHGQFAATLTSVEARLAKLKTQPNAPFIKAKIDAVAKAVADAKSKDKKHAGADAMAALRLATDTAGAAEQADRDRTRFNTDSAAVTALVAAVTDAKARTALTKSLADAKGQADKFRFDDAAKALKQIELRIDEIKLKATIGANPGDPNIAAIAAKMTAGGGGKNVDALLQAMPNNVDPRVITSLAQGRFGVGFAIDATAAPADEVKAMKACCKMFAKVSQNVKDNPSIKGISHADAVGNVGGAYDPNTATIKMEGRPKVANQDFGSKLKARTATGAHVNQLPKVDKACQPKNEKPVDFLDFAALHEVGHGVDDANNFMAQHPNDPKYGGWITYGSSVQPIADIIGPHFKFYTTAEQKQYVLDKLMSKPATPPPVPPLPGDWAKAKQDFDNWHALATSADVYRRQPDCDKLTIPPGTGRIYQEAYPRNWNSYPASARSKGLTGYQFRAPGEWFAELYAGYKSGKLGDKHPAVEWLKKL